MNKACVLAKPDVLAAAVSSGARLIGEPSSHDDAGTLMAWVEHESILPGSRSQYIVIDGDSVRFAYDLDT